MKNIIILVKEIVGTRLLGTAVLCAACILLPAAAWPLDVDLMLTSTTDEISNLNPPVSNVDVVYIAGPVKTADGLTTLGNWTCVVPRIGPANFNFFDCVIVVPAGNIYYKQVLNFSTGVQQGIILGGDGPFHGIGGTVAPVPGSGILFRFSFSLP